MIEKRKKTRQHKKNSPGFYSPGDLLKDKRTERQLYLDYLYNWEGENTAERFQRDRSIKERYGHVIKDEGVEVVVTWLHSMMKERISKKFVVRVPNIQKVVRLAEQKKDKKGPQDRPDQ